MQNCFIISALQHGRRENPLLEYNTFSPFILGVYFAILVF